MQVFLPDPDYDKSVACLDRRRLGNQIYRECLTLIKGGWKHHPASRMWVGYRSSLVQYALAGLRELARRGYCYPHHFDTFNNYADQLQPEIKPPWLGDPRLHESHRSQLLRKNPDHYSQFGWTEPKDTPYFWPSKHPDYSAQFQSVAEPL